MMDIFQPIIPFAQTSRSSFLLFNRYFHDIYSSQRHFLVPSQLRSNMPRTLTQFSIFSFIIYSSTPRTFTWWNGLPKWCYSDHWNLNLFKSRVNHSPSNIYSLSAPSFLYGHTAASFNRTIPSVGHLPCIR